MALLRLLARVPDVWKAAGIMAALFVGGLSAGALLSGWSEIPQKVSVLEVKAIESDADRQQMENELKGVRDLIRQQLCLTVAEKQRTPWQKCVDPNDFTGSRRAP